MLLLGFVLWSVHPLLALSSGPDRCAVHMSFSSQNVSPVLESLQCHNDYESFIYCRWREPRNKSLQLWLQTESNRQLCVQYSPPGQDGTVQCRCNTTRFSIGTRHTLFFLTSEAPTICSTVPVVLSQRLRAAPPLDLSTRDAGDGGRQLSWSSPYPSSSLNENLTYQLSYRTDGQDNWTTVDVKNTSMKLEKQLLLPGHRHEARARARASVGQWSEWSPAVSWHTQEDAEQPPSLQCVLDGEMMVRCSWEISRELSHFIVYQLHCRLNQNAPSEKCCANLTVSSDLSGTVLRYSCSLLNALPAHQLLELVPTRNAKTFEAYKHIHPKPPQRVEVKENNNNWIVEWAKPSSPPELKLYYQVCYYKTQDLGCSTCVKSSDTFLSIPGATLVPSQNYQVKVRSLVEPGVGSTYEGTPSEWTGPEGWTSHPASWSITYLLYFLISVFVAAAFLTFYRTFPTCRRRIILWVDSVPSPGKSKILFEIESATSRTFSLTEDTSICKVLHFDTMSTCSSDVSLWPSMDTDEQRLEPDESFWNCNNRPTHAETVNGSETSSMSFSGPYIFCQTNHKSVDPNRGKKEEEGETSKSSPSPINAGLYGDGYVCLPSRTMSRSTQDLVSHSDANTSTHRHGGTEQDQQRPDTMLWTDKMDTQPGLSEPPSSDQPPAYTSGPFSPWPVGSNDQASGYCFLPQPR